MQISRNNGFITMKLFCGVDELELSGFIKNISATSIFGKTNKEAAKILVALHKQLDFFDFRLSKQRVIRKLIIPQH